MMNHRANPKNNVNGSVTQTLDVLDFSVVHLSWYERLQKRHARKMKEELKIAKSDVKRMQELHSSSAIITTVEILKTRALKLRDPNLPFPIPELNRTVAVMPFLGSDMGAGHSNLGNRYNELYHFNISFSLVYFYLVLFLIHPPTFCKLFSRSPLCSQAELSISLLLECLL